ncbi:unnamed protein product [Caenorhabditis brenneri]
MPVPILRLPFLALKCLLNYTSKLEIIKLSLCSRKMDNALKRCGKNGSFFQNPRYGINTSSADNLELFLLEMKRSGDHTILQFHVYLTIENRLRIFVFGQNCCLVRFNIYFECIGKIDQYVGKRKNFMIGENCVPLVIDQEGEVTTFWNNKANGMISMIDYFCVSNKSPIEELTIIGSNQLDYSTNLRKLVHYMSSPGIEIESITIGYERKVSAKDFKYLLENVTVTGNFIIHERVPKNFKFDGKIKAESIRVNGSWFTLQHLLSTDYSEIHVGSHGITNEDIHRFMELWVAGEFPSLRHCEFVIKKLSIQTALSGITVRKYHRNFEKSIKGKDGAYAELDCYHGVFRFRVIKPREGNEIVEGEEQEESEEEEMEDDQDEEKESEYDKDEEEEEETDSDN